MIKEMCFIRICDMLKLSREKTSGIGICVFTTQIISVYSFFSSPSDLPKQFVSASAEYIFRPNYLDFKHKDHKVVRRKPTLILTKHIW